MAGHFHFNRVLLPIGAALFMIATMPLRAENVAEEPQSCYPGLPCPGAEQPPVNSGGQGTSNDAGLQQRGNFAGNFHYVGQLNPPDPWLALRSEPSSTRGHRIMKMPSGTLLRQLERRGFWWYVELTTGERGWAHSKWIKCCKSPNE